MFYLKHCRDPAHDESHMVLADDIEQASYMPPAIDIDTPIVALADNDGFHGD